MPLMSLEASWADPCAERWLFVTSVQCFHNSEGYPPFEHPGGFPSPKAPIMSFSRGLESPQIPQPIPFPFLFLLTSILWPANIAGSHAPNTTTPPTNKNLNRKLPACRSASISRSLALSLDLLSLRLISCSPCVRRCPSRSKCLTS